MGIIRNRQCRKTGSEKTTKASRKTHKKDTLDTHELNENLTLAKSYIRKLERRVLELENSNKIRNRGDRLHSNPGVDVGERQLPNKTETDNQTENNQTRNL